MSSSSQHTLNADAQVEAALQRYSALVLAMDYAAIAALFALDGQIINPGQAIVSGRAAIQNLFSEFSEYRVLANSTVPDSTVVQDVKAIQVGSYHQRVRTPQGQVLEVSGTFKAEWIRIPSDEWLIQSMSTTPSQ